MPLPKVFMTQKIQEAGMSILKDKVDITLWSDEGRPDPRTVKRDLPHAEGLIMTMGIPMDREFFKRAAKLRVASLYSVGYDNVDIAAATESGVMVTNTRRADRRHCRHCLMLMPGGGKAREKKGCEEGGWTHWSPNQFGAKTSGSVLASWDSARSGVLWQKALGFGMKIYTGRTRKPERRKAVC